MLPPLHSHSCKCKAGYEPPARRCGSLVAIFMCKAVLSHSRESTKERPGPPMCASGSGGPGPPYPPWGSGPLSVCPTNFLAGASRHAMEGAPSYGHPVARLRASPRRKFVVPLCCSLERYGLCSRRANTVRPYVRKSVCEKAVSTERRINTVRPYVRKSVALGEMKHGRAAHFPCRSICAPIQGNLARSHDKSQATFCSLAFTLHQPSFFRLLAARKAGRASWPSGVTGRIHLPEYICRCIRMKRMGSSI